MRCFSQAMMRDRVVSLPEANVFHAHTYRHFVSAFEILDQTGDQVSTRSNYLIMRAMNELNADIFQGGRYEDVVVRTVGGWRYKSKRAIFENARVDRLLEINRKRVLSGKGVPGSINHGGTGIDTKTKTAQYP